MLAPEAAVAAQAVAAADLPAEEPAAVALVFAEVARLPLERAVDCLPRPHNHPAEAPCSTVQLRIELDFRHA